MLAKVQVDNSLELGWRPDDILVVTNFPWEYRGVYNYHVPDDCYYPPFNRATKIPVINQLFKDGMITQSHWFHDFDAFQLEGFDEVRSDFAIKMYRHKKFKWNAGSFFFWNASDQFRKIEDRMWDDQIDEEDALPPLLKEGAVKADYMCPSLNMCIYDNLKGPVRVAHFHPRKSHHLEKFREFIPGRLWRIFKKHGIAA